MTVSLTVVSLIIAVAAPSGIGAALWRIIRSINRVHILVNSRVDILIQRNAQLSDALISAGIPIPAPRIGSANGAVKEAAGE